MSGENNSCWNYTSKNSCLYDKTGLSSEALFSSIPYYFYAIQGILFAIANCLIIGTILRHPQLRFKKEYVGVAGLAVGDLINEIAFAAGGIYRIVVTNDTPDKVCKNSWECMKSPHGIMWSLSFPLIYFMLLAISIDRLICVIWPMDYKSYSIRYSIKLMGSFYLLALTQSAVSIGMSWWNGTYRPCDTFVYLCFFDHMLGRSAVFFIMTGIQLACAAASVIIYGFIPFVYKRQFRRLSQLEMMGRAELIYLEEQRRLLVTLGISSIFTFLLMVVPTIIRMAMFYSNYEPFPYAGIIMNLNPLVNTLLFVLRHKHFRDGFLSIIRCRNVPIEVEPPEDTNSVHGDKKVSSHDLLFSMCAFTSSSTVLNLDNGNNVVIK